MSNYRAPAFNPVTKRVENADYIDNYFGRHDYGVRFDDGKVYRPWDVDILAAGREIERLKAGGDKP